MVSRESVFRASASAPEIGARSGPVWAWAPENSLRRRIGCARAQWIRGVSRRLGSSRPRFPSLWCRVRVRTPRSADAAQPRWHATGVVSALAVGHAGEWRSGRGAAATHPRHALAARPAPGRSHARRRSGPGSPQPIHALLHSNASVRPRRARPAARGTSRRRRPATRLRQCVAAEQLRGDDGARLRLLLPRRSEREVAPDETPVARPNQALGDRLDSFCFGRGAWNALGAAARRAPSLRQEPPLGTPSSRRRHE